MNTRNSCLQKKAKEQNKFPKKVLFCQLINQNLLNKNKFLKMMPWKNQLMELIMNQKNSYQMNLTELTIEIEKNHLVM